jgi:hypothetical protein
MSDLDILLLDPAVAKRVRPFFDDVLAGCSDRIHSMHVTGSAVTPDFNPKTSNINTLIVYNQIDFSCLSHLAPLGKKHRQNGIAAPLVMTMEYMRESLDVFPIEFLDLKLIHRTVMGDDPLKGLAIAMTDLRLQAEREIKSRLIGLWQAFIGSLGEPKSLATALVRSITGSMPLFRAVLLLAGKEPSIARHEVVDSLGGITSPAARTAFEGVLAIKEGTPAPADPALRALFEDYYHALESLSRFVNSLDA